MSTIYVRKHSAAMLQLGTLGAVVARVSPTCSRILGLCPDNIKRRGRGFDPHRVLFCASRMFGGGVGLE